MDAIQFHLIINHFPIVGVVFVFLLLLYAFFKKNTELTKIAVYGILLVSLLTVPAYLSGEEAAEHHADLFDKTLVHDHEEAAEFALALAITNALVAAAGIYYLHGKKQNPRWLLPALIILTAFSSAAHFRTAFQGGKINHPEIQR